MPRAAETAMRRVLNSRAAAARSAAVRRGYGHAVEPSFVRAALADRAPHSQSPMRTHAESSALVLCAIRHIFTRCLEGRPEAVTIGDSAPSLVSRAQIE